jgi:hypothetical protein
MKQTRATAVGGGSAGSAGKERSKPRREMVDHNTSLASDGPAADRSKSRQRSRVTNGTALLPGVDGRSAWVRRCKDLIGEHVADLGGPANTSVAERSLIRRAAVLTTELEMLEAKFAAAGGASADDLDLYQRTTGNLRRLLEAIGLRRRAKPVMSLDSFLAQQQRAKRGQSKAEVVD